MLSFFCVLLQLSSRCWPQRRWESMTWVGIHKLGESCILSSISYFSILEKYTNVEFISLDLSKNYNLEQGNFFLLGCKGVLTIILLYDLL